MFHELNMPSFRQIDINEISLRIMGLLHPLPQDTDSTCVRSQLSSPGYFSVQLTYISLARAGLLLSAAILIPVVEFICLPAHVSFGLPVIQFIYIIFNWCWLAVFHLPYQTFSSDRLGGQVVCNIMKINLWVGTIVDNELPPFSSTHLPQMVTSLKTVPRTIPAVPWRSERVFSLVIQGVQ